MSTAPATSDRPSGPADPAPQPPLAAVSQDPGSAPAAPDRLSFRLLLAGLIGAVFLLILGAMVTSTGSGMAFRDWPLANGSLWPDMDLDGYLEHVHRAIATVLGMFILVVAVRAVFRDPTVWRRRLAIGLLGLVVVQGLVGGFGVLKNTPVAYSTIHALGAQLVVATLVLLMFAYSAAWTRVRTPVEAGALRATRKLAGVTMGFMLVQLILGALVRHGGAEEFGWAMWTHVGFALVVSMMVLITCAFASTRLQSVPGVRGNTRWGVLLLVAQLTLGFFTLALRQDKHPDNIQRLEAAGVVSGHVVIGAALFVTMAMLLYRACRSAEAADGIPVEGRL